MTIPRMTLVLLNQVNFLRYRHMMFSTLYDMLYLLYIYIYILMTNWYVSLHVNDVE